MKMLPFCFLIGILLSPCVLATQVGAEGSTTPPQQFISDKPSDLAAIVRVGKIENRWVSIEGNMIPFVVSDCTLVEQIGGDSTFPTDASQTVFQSDYSSMVDIALAPPPLKGREYFLFATQFPEDQRPEGFDANWMVHPQGFFLIRGEGDDKFIYWDKQVFLISDLRKAIQGDPIPLSEIENPVKRIQIADQKIESGRVDDAEALIEGLAVNVRDPEGQSKLAIQPQKTDVEEDLEFMIGDEGNPHYIWYQSLALLRDLGRNDKYKQNVIDAIRPYLDHNHPKIPFVTALALAELGDESGKQQLRKAMEEQPSVVSAVPDSSMTYFGRYHYDDSTVLASAYALGLIGDKSGLGQEDVEIQLVTANGLMDSSQVDVKDDLQEIATKLDQEVESLRGSGVFSEMRSPSDRRGRYPKTWIKVHAMLGRLGVDESVEKLVRAWIQDLGTYPENDDLHPRSQVVSFDSHSKGWHSLNRALYATDESKTNLCDRLKNLFGDEEIWNEIPLVNLRVALGDASAVVPKAEDEEIDSVKGRIEDQLKSDDPQQRVEALAAAGHHRIEEYFPRVFDTALNGEGPEREASIYALGLFDRPIPVDDLKKIIEMGESRTRLGAFELATRREPGQFAKQGLDLARTLIKDLEEARKKDESLFDFEQSVTFVTQCLGRLPRNGIPEEMLNALNDPDPKCRKLVVQALGISGNPEAVPHLKPLLDDKSAEVREAAEKAIDNLGTS